MFIGREKELEAMRSALNNGAASVLIYGKRKVGKTSLILESLKDTSGKTIYLECLKASLKDNLVRFSKELLRVGATPIEMGFSSWEDAFSYLNSLGETFNIVIDEYPYLKIFEEPSYVDSLFQNIIDRHYENINLIISGSHISMMKDLLKEENALYGRFKLIINLKELDYREASLFYLNKPSHEKAAFYAVYGGSPFVNALIDQEKSLRENIISTILNPLSAVYSYVREMLNNEFTSSSRAERILSSLGNGKKKYGEIESALGLTNNGLLSKQLSNLLEMEAISKIAPINHKEDKKKTFYEISDNLIRFFYAYLHGREGILLMIGPNAFYDGYIEPSLTQFISRRYEEMVRRYFAIEVYCARLPGVLDIGIYYYDDQKKKRNGEFDVALERKNGYEIYEVEYLSGPLEVSTMHKEISQIRDIEELDIISIGFVSSRGYEAPIEGIVCLTGDDLYK